MKDISDLLGDAPAWQDDAACGEPGLDPHLFRPPPDTLPWRARQMKREALTICARCPVVVECGEHADALDEWGVWGGRYRR